VATPARGGRRVVVTGRLLLPRTAPDACGGSVRVTAAAGRRTVGSAIVTLRATGTACGYTARLTLPAGPRALTLSARFLGNDDLLPTAARGRTLRRA
jgi:hypothetical protein